jgi:hypothetical protein
VHRFHDAIDAVAFSLQVRRALSRAVAIALAGSCSCIALGCRCCIGAAFQPPPLGAVALDLQGDTGCCYV